jgi:hypothetical protein
MEKIKIPIEFIKDYRHKTFQLALNNRLHTIENAVEFINQRGILAFWPLKDLPMPSLWSAAAGDRPVADEHDDPGHITWGWKDDLLGQKRCYYARILCRRNFFVSLDVLPNLYALSHNFGDPAEDHLILYQSGELSFAAFKIYDTLLNSGPMDTLALKRAAHLSGKEGEQQFNQAIDLLQMDYKIMPVGISNAGGWRYAFIYDLVPRQFTDLIEKSRFITETSARKTLILNYMSSVGAAEEIDLRRLFRWSPDLLHSVLEQLVVSRLITSVDLTDHHSEKPGFVLSNLI